MTDNMHSTILRRMTGGQATDAAAEVPQTASRALRLALTRAANDTVGLVLTVTSTAEDEQSLDEMLDALDQQLMLIALNRADQLVGFIAVDMEFRAAVMEMQTIGALIPAVAENRAPTGTDKMMCDPVLAAFQNALPEAMNGTPLQGWVDGTVLGERIASARAAGLVLEDDTYRILRLNVDLGVADRQAQVLIALPLLAEQRPVPVATEEKPDWATLFPAAVQEAPVALDALLHRFEMPLARAHALQVGQVVPLLGCKVSSVRLMAPNGKQVMTAKLGQFGGKRAVRIETPPQPQMHELPGAPISQGRGMMVNELTSNAGPVPAAPEMPVTGPEALTAPEPAAELGLEESAALAPIESDMMLD